MRHASVVRVAKELHTERSSACHPTTALLPASVAAAPDGEQSSESSQSRSLGRVIPKHELPPLPAGKVYAAEVRELKPPTKLDEESISPQVRAAAIQYSGRTLASMFSARASS